VPTPMVAEPFFSVSAAVTPMVQGNMVVQSVIDSPVPMVVIVHLGPRVGFRGLMTNN
jgi:hypothetical protein